MCSKTLVFVVVSLFLDSCSSEKTFAFLSLLSSSSPTLNISQTCYQSLRSYFDDVANQSSALPELNFYGQFSPILLINNLRLIGSYNECLKINFGSVDRNISFHGVYCKTKMKIPNINPFNANESQQVSMELCAPSTCSPIDIKSLLSNQNEVVELESVTCHSQSVQILDASDITVICFLIILGLLTALGTCLSTYFRLCGHKPFRKRAKVLIAFSVYENSLKLMDTKVSERTIKCLHGLRFLALCFIVLGHTYSYHSRISVVDPESVRSGIRKLWFQVFLNFTPWVDTFFLISGLLVCYGGLYNFEKTHSNITEDEPVIKAVGYFTKTILSSVVHRYWRLTPTLGFVTCIYIVAGKIGSGPEWSLMTNISDPCKQTWWRNLIYINNFFSSNVCMGHTWYLADDFQFYVFSSIILVFLSSRAPFIGFSIAGSALFASIVATAVITFTSHSSATSLAVPISGTAQTIEEVHLYIWPFFRVGPFLIGILLGYIVLKHGDFVVSKRINLVLWFLCLSTITVITMASYRWANGHPASLLESVVYSSLHRIIWSICWSYMIVSCHYGHCPLVNGILGWNTFVPLGRLTYHAYLIHLLFIYIHIAANQSVIHFSHYNMFILFLGYLTISMLFSYLSAILFELPFTNLENIFWPKNPRDCEPSNGHLSASQSTCRSSHYQTETIEDRVVNLFPAKNVTQNNNVSSILVY